MSQGEGVDRITLALRERAAQVAADERQAVELHRAKSELYDMLGVTASLDPTFLVGLLRATWERLPTNLARVAWESPTAESPAEQVNEALAIGAAVADVFRVHEEQWEGARA